MNVKLCEPERSYWLSNWMEIHESYKNYSKLNKNNIKVIFFGASIVDHWKSDGKYLWDNYYVPKGAASYGIPGDNISNVLWRLQNKELDGLTPKIIIVTSGPGYNTIYQLIKHNTPPLSACEQVFRGQKKIIEELRSQFSYSKMIIIGHTPYNNSRVDDVSKQINEELMNLADNRDIYYLDLRQHLVDNYGKRLRHMFKDGVHLSTDAYNIWHKVMRPLFEQLI